MADDEDTSLRLDSADTSNGGETQKSDLLKELETKQDLFNKIDKSYVETYSEIEGNNPELADLLNRNLAKIDSRNRNYLNDKNEIDTMYANDEEMRKNKLAELEQKYNPLEPMIDDLDALLPEDIRSIWDIPEEEMNLKFEELGILDKDEQDGIRDKLRSWKTLESQILQYASNNKSKVEAQEIYKYFTFLSVNLDEANDVESIVRSLKSFIDDRTLLIAQEELKDTLSNDEALEYMQISIGNKKAMLDELVYYQENEHLQSKLRDAEVLRKLAILKPEQMTADMFGRNRRLKERKAILNKKDRSIPFLDRREGQA